MQLSRLYTGGTEVVVTDNAFHGSIDSVHMLSPKVFKANNIGESSGYWSGTPDARWKFCFRIKIGSRGWVIKEPLCFGAAEPVGIT